MIGPLRNAISAFSDYTLGTAIVVVFLSTVERRMRRMESQMSERLAAPSAMGTGQRVSHEWNV